MPQHNTTRYLTENSHLSQVEVIDKCHHLLPEGVCYSCDKLLFAGDFWVWIWFSYICEDCVEYGFFEPPSVSSPCSVILRNEKPNHVSNTFEFHRDLRQVIPPNCTPQHLMIHRGDKLDLIPLGRSGYLSGTGDSLLREKEESLPEKEEPIIEVIVDGKTCMIPRRIFEEMERQYLEIPDLEIVSKEEMLSLFVVEEGVKLADSKLRDELEGMTTLRCEVVENKELIVCYPVHLKAKTLQYWFINEMIWVELDWDQQTAKRVSPQIYPIGDHDFDLTYKVQKKWKKSRQTNPKVHFCKDGDLNGGFTDEFLFKAMKENHFLTNEDIISHSRTVIRIPESALLEFGFITSIRPFHSNPDLFHVKLMVRDLNNDRKEYMFGFQFKLVEEFKENKKKLIQSLKSSNFTDCTFVNTL